MTKFKNVPDVVRLNDDDVLCLSIACAWHHVFPPMLRQQGRLKSHHLQRSIESKEISAYGLLSAAYIGVAPLPSSYNDFLAQARRTNKLQLTPESSTFLKDRIARESSAASQ